VQIERRHYDLLVMGAIPIPYGWNSSSAALLDRFSYRQKSQSLFRTEQNGTLTNKELGGRAEVMRQILPSPNPYKMFAVEGAMNRDDYLSLTETRFKLADPDNDGKLDAKELDSEAGQALLKLLQ
jgi:hypothetical protein